MEVGCVKSILVTGAGRVQGGLNELIWEASDRIRGGAVEVCSKGCSTVEDEFRHCGVWGVAQAVMVQVALVLVPATSP